MKPTPSLIGSRMLREQLDTAIDRSYTRQSNGKHISVLKINTLFTEVRNDVAAGKDLDQAVGEAITRHCELCVPV